MYAFFPQAFYQSHQLHLCLSDGNSRVILRALRVHFFIISALCGWRFGAVVTRWSRSTQLVALHRARLVLGWVTAFGQVNCLIT